MGRRVRNDWIVYWSGNPTFFSFIHPYIIAFDTSFIEIRHIETGNIQQVIHAQNLRVLSVDPSVMECVMDSPDLDSQIVFKLRIQSEFMQ